MVGKKAPSAESLGLDVDLSEVINAKAADPQDLPLDAPDTSEADALRAEVEKMKALLAEANAKLTAHPKQSTEKAVSVVIDPEDDRDNWPTIFIDQEDEKPNYEVVSAFGTKTTDPTKPVEHTMQIMRGVNVKVPPSIVYALRDAVSTRYTSRKDPSTGRSVMVPSKRSDVPWRLISGGKYC